MNGQLLDHPRVVYFVSTDFLCRVEKQRSLHETRTDARTESNSRARDARCRQVVGNTAISIYRGKCKGLVTLVRAAVREPWVRGSNDPGSLRGVKHDILTPRLFGKIFFWYTGQLILSKVIKIVATSCRVLRLKCSKFDFGWGSAPDPLRELTALPHTPDWI